MVDTSGGPDACHEWLGGVGHYGHGVTSFPGIGRVYVHRLFWIIENGDPGTLSVLHSCDNPPCCNVRHMFLGTRADNIADMFQKRRGNPWPHKRKLTNTQVKLIRMLARNGMRQRDIAARFSVQKNTVNRIINKKRRQHD